MKIHSILGGLLLALTLCGCDKAGPSKGDDKAAKEVQAAWDEFKAASLSGKGSIAADRVTKATHDYYDEIRVLALKATRQELAQMTIAKQVTVMGMRVRVDPAQLNQMSGRDLMAYAVDKGWIGKNSATDEGITAIVVTGDHARARATKAGRPVNQYFHFLKEDGQWRLDMMQLMKVVNTAMDAMQKESGLKDEDFVAQVIESITGKRLSPKDWEPK